MGGRCSRTVPLRCWADRQALLDPASPGALAKHGVRGLLLPLLLTALLGLPVPPAWGAVLEQRCAGPNVTADRCIAEPFYTFWEQHGGREVFGWPLGPAIPNTTAEGSAGAQYFSNARLEWYPANPDPYRVLLGRLGEERLTQLGQLDLTSHSEAAQEGCRFFDTTRHNVCGAFLAYWQSHGLRLDDNEQISEQESMALLGLPITAVQEEVDPSGEIIRTQWFERAQLIDRNGAIAAVPLGEQVMLPEQQALPFDGPEATPPAPMPPQGHAEPSVTQPAGSPPGPVRYDTFPAAPCNRNVPAPRNGLQLWAYTEGDDMVVCAWLLLEGAPVQGATITGYRHHQNGAVLPTLSHTTGHYYGVVSFIFYVGHGLAGQPDYIEAVAAYQGRTYRATVVP